ncbi:MAG: hypothetical protein IJR59_01840, partial [Firmicutes bacterium]|nr:hypothetical protein [Bacillota bacterium]
ALRGPPPLIAALKGRLGRYAPSANATLSFSIRFSLRVNVALALAPLRSGELSPLAVTEGFLSLEQLGFYIIFKRINKNLHFQKKTRYIKSASPKKTRRKTNERKAQPNQGIGSITPFKRSRP